MAVSTPTSKNDPAGVTLDAKVTAAAAVVAALPASSTLAVQNAQAALRQAQIDTVVYYLNTGRINPATVLSTLS
jgi:hypothetical protein